MKLLAVHPEVHPNATKRRGLKLRAIERRALKLRAIKDRALKLRALKRRALKLRLMELRALKLRGVERRALKLRGVERRALKLRAVERRALKARLRATRPEAVTSNAPLESRAGEIRPRKSAEVKPRAFQVPAAGAKHKIPPLDLLRIVDAQALVDVETSQDQHVGKRKPSRRVVSLTGS